MNLQNISQPFLEKFPGDDSLNAMQRQTPGQLYARVQPVEFPQPKLLHFNKNLSEELGLGEYSDQNLSFLVGNQLPENIRPYATAYAGHQFGNWAGQLGDGRAILAGEISSPSGKSFELQWKGTGATPYSRFADGRAVLRSSVREYLMSEAMHALGIPTTRALSLCLTGEQVIRDILYSGNPQPEPGAVVLRTAESFLRFGHFEFAAAQQDEGKMLKNLTNYTISRYYPHLNSEAEKYGLFFREICHRTADMIVEWMRVGFTHGVMNTDNMSVLGLTVDYGPYGMLEQYDLNFTPNTTDMPGRRYAFGQQPQIGQWNLWQLANALQTLMPDKDFLEETLNEYAVYFWQKHDTMMRQKMGLRRESPEDEVLILTLQKLLTEAKMDYTLFFQKLPEMMVKEDPNLLLDASYDANPQQYLPKIADFFQLLKMRWQQEKTSVEEKIILMQAQNPAFILRNFLLYECIEQLENQDFAMLHKLWESLQKPSEVIHPEFHQKRPEKYTAVPGCSTLSCSS